MTTVKVSAYKATNASRFDALRNFTVQTSTDGRTWSTALGGSFRYQAPRPVAPDLNIATFTLATPTRAAFVRFVVNSVQGDTSDAGAGRGDRGLRHRCQGRQRHGTDRPAVHRLRHDHRGEPGLR